MPSVLVVVTVALGCILLTTAIESCTVSQFTCDNLNCIQLGAVCNGRVDCDDRTDELPSLCSGKAKGSLFGVGMSASDNFQVDVVLSPNNNPYSVSGDGLSVAVCGPTSCTGHTLSGLDDRIEPYSSTFKVLGNNLGWDWRTTGTYNGVRSWAPGILLEVEKHNRLLAVWPTGRPDLKRWTECDADENTLLIRSTTLGNATLLRAGLPVPVGPVLVPGQQISVDVLVSNYAAGSVQLGLCNARACAVSDIETPFREGYTVMDYSTGITSTNNPDDHLNSIIHSSIYGRSYWAPDHHQFLVAFHPDGFLQVWQPADPNTVAEVPIPEDLKNNPVLKVVASHGNAAYTSLGIKSRKDLPVPRTSL